jgi:hypothetical protein
MAEIGLTATWTKSELQQFFLDQDNILNRLSSVKANLNGEPLWAFSGRRRGYGTQISILAENQELRQKVVDSLDRIGASEITITNMLTREHRKTNQADWKDWFIGGATLGFKSVTVDAIHLVPDTNFVRRRYASGLLRRLGKEAFKELQFSIPNLVILEIEASHNRAKSKAEKPKCEEIEKQKALTEIRESLIATKELMFLLEIGARMLPSNLDNSFLDAFSTIAGKGVTDLFIRKEIRDCTNLNKRFLTCDLMNSLAAMVEGLGSFYFSRDENEFTLSAEREVCMEQLSELVIDTVTLFGEANLTISSAAEAERTFKLSGKWRDWTPVDLLKDTIIEVS